MFITNMLSNKKRPTFDDYLFRNQHDVDKHPTIMMQITNSSGDNENTQVEKAQALVVTSSYNN